MLGVPGIAGRSLEPAFGGAQDGQLGEVGLGHEDQAGAAQAGQGLGVVVGHEALEETGPGRERFALHEAVEVLDDHGHAAEGPVGQVAGRGPGAVIHRVHHRVQSGIHRLDTGDGLLDELDRPDLAAADAGGQLGSVTGGIVVQA